MSGWKSHNPGRRLRLRRKKQPAVAHSSLRGRGPLPASRRIFDAMTDALDEGPFFHGTRAQLHPGELLGPGFDSNYRPEIVMNHIYFTALPDAAGLAAEIAALDSVPHVYEVEPLGEFENDPNVTDKKFPGNPTRSFRSTAPLRVIREVTNWKRLTSEELQSWREKLAALLEDDSAEIIN